SCRRRRQPHPRRAHAHRLFRHAARLRQAKPPGGRTHRRGAGGTRNHRNRKEKRMKTGGQLIVDALVANGVKRIACVPGESYLAVLDALHDTDIDTLVCRQEGGAAMMADCWGRLTGEPGICMVTRGPGATNASAGLHIARQDSVPMILFIGQVQRDAREREAFQEIEYRRAFTEVAKWVAEIDDARRIPEFVTRAFAVATSG